MKLIYTLLFFAFCGPIVAQQHAFSIRNSMSNEKLRPRKVHIIKDSLTQNTAVFMIASKAIYGLLYNDDLILQKKIKTAPLAPQFKNFQGITIKNNTYSFLLSNQSNKKFGVVFFDFDNRRSSSYKLDFTFKKESFLNVVSHREHCYLLTADKKNTTLHAYSFSDDWNAPEKTSFRFDEKSKNSVSFNTLFGSSPVAKIENGEPVSLDQGSALVKLYQKGPSLKIVSNVDKENTHLLQINLENNGHSLQKFTPPQVAKFKSVPKSNSFILEDLLFQMAVNSEGLSYNITSLKTKEVLNTFEFSKDEDIDFKNGSFFKKSTKTKTNLNNSKDFLRNLFLKNPSITAYKKNTDYIVSVGGVETEPNLTYVFAGGVLGGLMGGLVVAYLSDQGSKSFGFNSILNKDFKHIHGDVEKHWFDIINSFSKSNKAVTESLFKHNDSYYWGNYSFKNDLYNFYKFN